METQLGRLKKSTKEICDDCGKKGMHLLSRQKIQLIKGENVEKEELYLFCQSCENEKPYKDKRHSRKRDWKPVEPPPEPEPKYVRKNNIKKKY